MLVNELHDLRMNVFKLKGKPGYDEEFEKLKKFAEKNKEVLEGQLLFEGYTYSAHDVVSEDYDVKLDRKNSASVDASYLEPYKFKFSDLL